MSSGGWSWFPTVVIGCPWSFLAMATYGPLDEVPDSDLGETSLLRQQRAKK